MIDLKRIQKEQKEWSEKNFGKQIPSQMIMEITEELGELCHAQLKMEQGIRTTEDHEAKAKDAVGDIIIYLMGCCNIKGYLLSDCIYAAWDEVKERDWKKNPERG